MPNIDFYYKRSRLNQLKGFCSVVQNDCCIAKASKKTNVAQDTISKQVRTLERDLKIKLFERTKHHTLIITQEGQLFYDKAIANLNAMNSLFENFHKDLKEFNNNHLRIAAHQMAITYILPKIIGKMLKLKEFKNLKINIFNLPKNESIKKLLEKEIDLVFDIQNVKEKNSPEIETIKSIQSRAFLLYNKQHPIAKLDKITMNELEKYIFLNRNTESKILSNYNINFGNISINGNLPPETIIEIVKYTNNLGIITNMCMNEIDFIHDDNVIVKDIENLLIDKAFFHIMTLKNCIINKPMEYLINELKKIKQ